MFTCFFSFLISGRIFSSIFRNRINGTGVPYTKGGVICQQFQYVRTVLVRRGIRRW